VLLPVVTLSLEMKWRGHNNRQEQGLRLP